MPLAYSPSAWLPGTLRGKRSEDDIDPAAVSRAISRILRRAFACGYRHGWAARLGMTGEHLDDYVGTPYVPMYRAGYDLGQMKRRTHRGTLYLIRGIEIEAAFQARFGT